MRDRVYIKRHFDILYRNNVGYASTCNATGQVIGIMIGSLFSVLFTSEDFCNKYLRVTPGTGGIMTMRSKWFKQFRQQYIYVFLFMKSVFFFTIIHKLKKVKNCVVKI